MHSPVASDQYLATRGLTVYFRSAKTFGISICADADERNHYREFNAILATSNSTQGQQSERENSYATP
jgi:hypothetical protein